MQLLSSPKQLRYYLQCVFGLALWPLAAVAHAQSTTPDVQISHAFNGGRPIQSVTMTGTAQLDTGATKSSVPVTLLATPTGDLTVAYTLANGQSVDQSNPGTTSASHSCSHTDSTGETQISSSACWLSVAWFLPQLTLQPENRNPVISVASSAVPNCVGICIDTKLSPASTPPTLSAPIQRWSMATLTVDPNSYLPINLTYLQSPDDGSPVAAKVEVRYTDYRLVNRATFAFHLDKYINGHLSVSIQLSTVQVQ